jgi:hypothetical protein
MTAKTATPSECLMLLCNDGQECNSNTGCYERVGENLPLYYEGRRQDLGAQAPK